MWAYDDGGGGKVELIWHNISNHDPQEIKEVGSEHNTAIYAVDGLRFPAEDIPSDHPEALRRTGSSAPRAVQDGAFPERCNRALATTS